MPKWAGVSLEVAHENQLKRGCLPHRETLPHLEVSSELDVSSSTRPGLCLLLGARCFLQAALNREAWYGILSWDPILVGWGELIHHKHFRFPMLVGIGTCAGCTIWILTHGQMSAALLNSLDSDPHGHSWADGVGQLCEF